MRDSSIDKFLDDWVVDNKVRGLFFSPHPEITIRFLASAFFYKENIAFGYVHTRSMDVGEILKKYSINKHRETLLLFNEEISSPVASLSVSILLVIVCISFCMNFSTIVFSFV